MAYECSLALELLLLLRVTVLSSTSDLPSKFYKPGRGVILEKWVLTSSYDINQFNKIPNYPGCPTNAFNLDSFSDDTYIAGKYQHNRYSAYFVSSQSGIHEFSVRCNFKCQLEIEILPFGTKNILSINSPSRKWSEKVVLQKGFRYLVRGYQYANARSPEYFKLGVKFPDGSEVDPIDNRFLWRSMILYLWQGLLGQRYDGMNVPYGIEMPQFYTYNTAKYPDHPTAYQCASTLYEPFRNIGEYYAMQCIGYMKFYVSATYTFRVSVNEIGEIFVTKDNVETSLGHFSRTKSPKNVDAGYFKNNTYYKVRAAMVENFGSNYIQIKHSTGNNQYNSTWKGMLRNLISGETAQKLPKPACNMINASVISATLTVSPYLPPKDNWTFTGKFDILAFETSGGETAPIIKLESSGLPQTLNFSGLKNYTDYTFYVQYYGKINNVIEYNIISSSVIKKTGENVPEAPPTGIFTSVLSSKSVRVTWRSYTNVDIVNGICIGYEVRYKMKGDGNWTSVIIDGTSNREYTMVDLEEYTAYEVIVAGMTSIGAGVFSSPAEMITKQDAPSAPPLNIAAKNTSSSSINITWNEVSFWDRNGIITGYNVYISKVGDGSSPQKKKTTERTLAIDGLDFWHFYDVQVAALTEKGEGPKSNATRVRTDEDKPASTPTSIAARAISGSVINVTWSEIDASKTHGIILEYKIKFHRSDGAGAEHEVVTSSMSALLPNLEAFVDYDIRVAGATSKGFGVYSSDVKEKTLQAEPDLPPTAIFGNNISSTAIKVSWGMIPEKHRNGDITGYMIKYRETISQGNWRIIVVNSTSLNLVITGLDFYTLYDIKIAGKNVAGVGVYSNITVVRTDADAPGKAPMNLTGHFLNHTSIVMTWQRVPKLFRFGTILGYRLLYRDKTLMDSPWVSVTVLNRFKGSDTFNATITGLKIYTPYVFKITAFTVSDGPYSENVTVWTDEHVPENPPRNLNGKNASSTELVLSWNNMDEIHGDANGEVLGYTVRYHVIDCHEDRPIGCDEKDVFNTTSYGRQPTIRLPNLRKYTLYNISIRVFNSKGEGNFSNEVTMRTDEDKPDAPPQKLETWPAEYDAIKVFWSPIPESLRNGIILGYRIFYMPIEIPLHKYYRAPRSVNPLAIFGAEPGEKMLEVNATTYSIEIGELRNYSWYRIRIGAFTSKGIGQTLSINGTCKQKAPTAAPQLMIKDKYDFYEIFLRWNEINGSYTNGEILGYHIKYWLKELFFTPILSAHVMKVMVWAPNTSVILVDLKPFATYGMTITAFTEGGIGKESEIYYAETCRCPKILSTSKIRFPPLVQEGDEHQNLLAHIVNDAITSCCGNCSNGHGTTEIDWKRDASNSYSLKFSKEDAVKASLAGTHVTVPIFRDMDDIQASESNNSAYVPVLAVTTFNTFSKKPSLKVIGNAAAKIMLNSLWGQYPLLLVSTVLTILAGILFRAAESNVNKDEFSDHFINGSGSGIWLAFVTMTTVGYGDLTPMTKFGRVFAVVWMLVGVVLTSIFIGNLSNMLSMDFVFNPQPWQSKGKVLTSDESILITSKTFGRGLVIGNTSDGRFIQKSLFSGNVSRVFIDSYQASSLRDFLFHPDIILDSIHDVKASYGVLLSGEAKRLSTCVNKYVEENENNFLKKIANTSYTYKLGSFTVSKFYNHMTSSHSDIMGNLTQYGGMVFGILLIFGTFYEIMRCFRGRAKVSTSQTDTVELFKSIHEPIANLEKRFQEKLDAIETRHWKERLELNKMQIGKFEALLKMYPDLPLYDPTIPNTKKQPKENYNATTNYDVIPDEESSSEEIDIPIYYKRSQANLQP